ncbi:phospholipase D-like domain-containing protein [Blautia massiliensis (ex Durand et al. 2017)]|uniref:phospholipase D-like domain-containing protein n=1 Tax=Blautia massiliensis (ex Durand et al. 2017) TaxID=1737424 RepID=UPI0023EC4C66|nr:phospholipase D-like domain-containing protein [Blautia massiliensis (ex Durand et al. 2017)]
MTVQTYAVVRGILGFIFALLIIATAYCYHDWVQVVFLFALSVILYLILFAGVFVDALCLAAKRGVDVRIITPGIPDKKFIYNITRSFYHGLVKHGVRVYEWTPGFCHAKMSVADDCMATCGTINLDYRSLYHHFENGCFMADCQAVVEIKNDLIRTMGECRDVTDQYQTGRSAYLRLGQLFMRLFAGLL